MDSTDTRTTEQRPGLAATLRSRHLSMIGFGGAVGAGIFVGSGDTISKIGPAIVIGYVVVGLLAAIAMRLLSVQAQRNPDSGAFATYVGDAFGHIGRFAIGWMYWWLLVATAAVECIAAANIAHGWVPAVPQWAWSILFFAVLTAVNLARVHIFGEIQFWVVLIKVVMVIAIPALGLLAAFGLFPGVSSPGTSNIVYNGGLVPRGWGSVFPGILLAAFSFVGIEMTAVASAEAHRPGRAVRRSTRFVTYTVSVAYVVALLVTVLLKPWNDPAVAAGPFGAMMNVLHLPAAGTVIDIVVFTAVLSVANSCLYAGSRMGFSLAQRHDAPKSWGRLSRFRVPATAVAWTAVVSLAVTLFGYIAPNILFEGLIDSTGAVLLMVWIAIALSYLKVRPKAAPRLGPAGPVPDNRLAVAAWLVSAAMVVMLIGMIFVPDTQLQLIMTAVLVLVIFMIVLWRETSESADPDW